ncbi:hypothetical protein [Anaerovibrio slackiae]|uniref:hypothetical protein n=1 Tax=Anaerovibrio slackiae TaxID=2652309 RepID=UPI0038643891
MATTDLGKNIHNAFSVVFNTYKSIEKLMLACQSDEVKQNYYLPTEKFLRYSSDQYWEGWVYWSFILLYQRNADGKCPENGWIDAPVYAVEINVDAETCEEPKIYVGKFEYKDICSWTPGCSPANHYIFYDAMHNDELFKIESAGDIKVSVPVDEKVSGKYWGLKKVTFKEINLVDINADNYYDEIFGTIESLENNTSDS